MTLVSANSATLADGMAASAWLAPYQPLLEGGHQQTLLGNFWRRPLFSLPYEAETITVDPADGSRVLCHCHWQRNRAENLTLLLVHGLEGSSDSGYIRGITQLAWAADCNVVRMNMRNCGGTDTWTPTLYHSGLSADVEVVLRHLAATYALPKIAMAGYSMGGNLVLKLAGELARNVPSWLVAAVGVSAATDLGPSADALHEPANRMYEWHFLRNLMHRFRRKCFLFPAIYSMEGLGPIRTIRDFDNRITARYSGFVDADDYYYRASSARVVPQIAIPTLVLHATDDPFIRMAPATRASLSANPAIDFIETQQGGHCAFLARSIGSNPQPERHWAESTLVRFVLARAEQHKSELHGS
jgi:predicted alpha/beta-fold hydrolase